jgi:hypothetical protein
VAANVVVTPAGVASYQPTTVAVDPADQDRIAIAIQVIDAGMHSACAVAISEDAGRSWRTIRVAGVGSRYALPAGFDGCQQPTISYVSGGLLAYAYMASSGAGYANVFLTAVDATGKLASPRLIDPGVPGPTSRCCGGGDWYPALSAAPWGRSGGTLFAAWVRFDLALVRGQVMLASCPAAEVHRLAAGRIPRCSSPTPVSDPSGTAQLPVIAVGRTGQVAVGWQDASKLIPTGYAAPLSLVLAGSDNGGRSFGAPVHAVRGVVTGCRLARTFRCDPAHWSGPLVHHSMVRAGARLLWTWFQPAEGNNRVLISSSRDGSTWSAARVVAVPAGGDRHHLHHPSLAVSPSGRIDLAFYDLSPDLRQRVYVVSSHDRGRTFGEPRLVSREASDARVGPPSSWGSRSSDLGGPVGLASTDDSETVAWTMTDPASGTQVVAFARPAPPPAPPPVEAALGERAAIPSTFVRVLIAVGTASVLAAMIMIVMAIRGWRRPIRPRTW